MPTLAQALREGDSHIDSAAAPASCSTCNRWRMARFNGEETCAGCCRLVEDCICEPLPEVQI
jgi:hypothetical protein